MDYNITNQQKLRKLRYVVEGESLDHSHIKNNWYKKSPWRLHALVSTVGLFIIVTMSYGFYFGNYTTEKHTPLIDATMEIKLEATIAHLWFEEIISGDRISDIKEIHKHLDEAKWYADSMLKGGENAEGRFIPLTNPILRGEIKKVLESIEGFRAVGTKRIEEGNNPGNELLIRQFDEIFDILIYQADKVETALQTEIKENIKIMKIIQAVLTIVCFISIVLIMWLFHRFDSRRLDDLRKINTTNENLLKALDEVKTLQGIIPICGYCKQIRDEKGLWNQLEAYINSHSEAEFSHGVCPECYKKQMEELKKYAIDKRT